MLLTAGGLVLWAAAPFATGPADLATLGLLVFWAGLGYLGLTLVAAALLDWLASTPGDRTRRN